MSLYNDLLYQPLLNALFFLYNLLPVADMGMAIVLLTLVVKLLLLPPTLRTVAAQRRMAGIQPKIDALKERVGNDKERMAKELMELYKKEKVNPLSSCLPLLIQLPLLIALYHVFQQGLQVPPDGQLYRFVQPPESISPLFLGMINLSKPNFLLVALTAVAQYVQTKMLPTSVPKTNIPEAKDERQAALLNRQMQFIGPLLTLVIGFGFPSALILYWLVSTLAQIGIQWYGLRSRGPL